MTIDKRQDKMMIEQLSSNQLALTQGFENLVDSNHNIVMLNKELPQAIEGPKEEKEQEEKGLLYLT